MRFLATTTAGKEISLPAPISMSLVQSFDTPASGFSAVFPLFAPVGEIMQICVWQEETKLFCGDVDEQRLTCQSDGIKLRVSARSFAELLDNEAFPTTYNRCSLKDLYERHLKPYGIKGVLGEGRCQGDFAIAKGTCEWAVISDFCKGVMNVQPSITREGYLDARGTYTPKKQISFSNTETGSIPFYTAQVKLKRCKVIGKVIYKSDATQGYTHVEENADAVKRGIQTVRYLNLSSAQKWEKQYRLYRQIQDSLRGSDEIKLCVPFSFTGQTGDFARFSDARLGTFEHYRIFEVEHKIMSSGKQCMVTLRPAVHF